jgi:hypothetical protein
MSYNIVSNIILRYSIHGLGQFLTILCRNMMQYDIMVKYFVHVTNRLVLT